MENLTNEEKAQEIAKRYATPCQGFGDCEYEAYQSALEAMEWKDEQHKQELIRIYNFVNPYFSPEAINDLKIIIGIC